MAHKNQITFTDKIVAKLPAAPEAGDAKSVQYSDTQIPRLKLEVSKTGHKSFRVRYMYRGKRDSATLGSFPATSVVAARERALEVLAALERGEDPKEDRRRAEAVPTFADFAAGSYLDYAKAYKRSHKADESKLRVHLIPKWGHRRLDNITMRDVQIHHAEVAKSHCPSTANRHLALLSKMFGLAVDWGMLTENPCRAIKQFKEDNHRQRFLTSDEVRRLMNAIDDEPNKTAAAVLKLLLLTGMRREEGMRAQWSNVDLEKGNLFLPTTKSGRGRYVVLNDDAIELLASQPSRGKSPWVFPGADPAKALVNPVKAFSRIKARAGIEASFRIHDLRHSFASMVVNSGASLYSVQQLLGHSSPQMTQRYAHLSDSEQRKASQSVSRAVRLATEDLSPVL